MDADKLNFEDGSAIMDETIDYFPKDIADVDVNAPIYAKIIDYPIIKTDIMEIGEGLLLGADLSDYGGRNHAHTTVLKILSGNCTMEIELPIIVYAKKDMTVNLYMSGDRIRKVFCDGIMYKF